MTAMQIISRSEALSRGLKVFFNGNPCKHGHVAEKRVDKGTCCECIRITQRDRLRQKRASDPEFAEERRLYLRKYYASNPERGRGYQKKYRANNPDAVRDQELLRRSSQRNATPDWLTKEHKREMRLVSKLAEHLERQYGIPFHVDHIIPLSGENVCGLHVPANLRVIPAAENLSKSNKFIEELAQPACVVTVLKVVLPKQHNCAILGTES